MGNKQVNLHKRQMAEMRKAVDNKATTKIVALIKSYADTNNELVKEGCQALFYSLGRESEIKKESDLEIFRKAQFTTTLVTIIKRADKAPEPAAWACGIIMHLSAPATKNRKYENISQELIDAGVCDAIHQALKTATDDYLKENADAAKKNIMKMSTGESAFSKLS